MRAETVLAAYDQPRPERRRQRATDDRPTPSCHCPAWCGSIVGYLVRTLSEPSSVPADISGSSHGGRGTGPPAAGAAIRGGLTPGCAGSSVRRPARTHHRWDHPRVRGEQAAVYRVAITNGGSPPCGRGAEGADHEHGEKDGITPACAGSSTSRLRPAPAWRNHPSHARGSRCRPRTGSPGRWDHPRVRGEQDRDVVGRAATLGSPPRARGAGALALAGSGGPRITPVCAGSRLFDLGR